MAGEAVLWALALLTKIHAWLLIPVLGLWAFVWLPPLRALAVMATWLVVGIGVFWLGWPWLWYDSVLRFLNYWGTGVARCDDPGPVFRPGDRRSRRAVALPLVLFRGDSAFGPARTGCDWAGRGWIDRRTDSLPLLLSGSILLFLGLFSTRVPVYDGERLFLHVFRLGRC